MGPRGAGNHQTEVQKAGNCKAPPGFDVSRGHNITTLGEDAAPGAPGSAWGEHTAAIKKEARNGVAQ